MKDEKNTNISDRIRQIVEYKGMSVNQFSIKVGVSNSYFNKVIRNKISIGSDKLQKILRTFEEISPVWLILGEGQMLRPTETSYKNNVPFYNSPDISIEPSGYFQIPHVKALAFFKVIGFNFEPLIRSGDIIGINPVSNLGSLDPDKVYYIVTDDARMIKHAKLHPDNDDSVMLISSTNKEIIINPTDIKELYEVVFYGRLT